jgi:hypothetical protein
MRRLVLFAALMLLPLFQTSAQLTPLVTGSKVKISGPVSFAGRAAGTGTVKGFVLGVTSDTLLVRSLDGMSMTRVPLSDVTSVDVSLGKDRMRGSLRGTAIGAISSAALFALTPIECDGHGRGPDCLADGSKPSRGSYVTCGTLGGAMIGALIGAYVGVERWQRFTLASRVQVASRGNGVGLAIRY